jgi:hypothetical protein
MLARCGSRALPLVMLALLATGGAATAAERTSARNPANDRLLKLSPPERAASLAHAVGNWCIGTEAFLMGVIDRGRGEGNAYWSLRCADGTAWAVQIDPLAEITAIDCETFKADGAGKECFKKF